jgi:hypothetical protein
MLDTTGRQQPMHDRKDDLHETPRPVVEALLRIQKIPHVIWEPACGPGSIVKCLRDHGHEVIASDLVDYQCPNSQSRIDFLMERRAPDNCECVLTNPPFKLARQFAEHATDLCPLVYMFLRFAFYESECRSDLLENRGLSNVYCFRRRVPMMHRQDWTGKKAGSGIAFGWFVWRRGYTGKTQLERISWDR